MAEPHLPELANLGLGFSADDPDGWHLSTPSQVVVVGAGCEAIQTGRAIDIDFPREIFVPK